MPHAALMVDKSHLIASVVPQLTVLVAFEIETSETEKEAQKEVLKGQRGAIVFRASELRARGLTGGNRPQGPVTLLFIRHELFRALKHSQKIGTQPIIELFSPCKS